MNRDRTSLLAEHVQYRFLWTDPIASRSCGGYDRPHVCRCLVQKGVAAFALVPVNDVDGERHESAICIGNKNTIASLSLDNKHDKGFVVGAFRLGVTTTGLQLPPSPPGACRNLWSSFLQEKHGDSYDSLSLAPMQCTHSFLSACAQAASVLAASRCPTEPS